MCGGIFPFFISFFDFQRRSCLSCRKVLTIVDQRKMRICYNILAILLRKFTLGVLRKGSFMVCHFCEDIFMRNREQQLPEQDFILL